MPFDNRREHEARWAEAARREQFMQRAPATVRNEPREVVRPIPVGGAVNNRIINWDMAWTASTPTVYTTTTVVTGGTANYTYTIGDNTYYVAGGSGEQSLRMKEEPSKIPKGTKVIMIGTSIKGEIGTIEERYLHSYFVITVIRKGGSTRIIGRENVDFIVCSDNEEIE